MIPSDHFVRFYNEVFKTLMTCGRRRLLDYWRELGRLQTAELSDRFREGGLQAAHDYWSRIRDEENCDASLALTEDYFEFSMHSCPSLGKVLDNDAEACELYCDHCMGWIEDLMRNAGLYAVMDMRSRSEPHCTFRVYTDPEKAKARAREAALLSCPYEDPAVAEACGRAERSRMETRSRTALGVDTEETKESKS